MVDLLSIALLQCAVSAAVVYLRLLSFNRALMQPPKGWKKKVLEAVSAGKNGRGLFFSWKVGAVRRQLLLMAKTASRFSNYNDAPLLSALVGTDDADNEEKENIVSHLNNNDGKSHNHQKLFGFFHPFCNAGGGGEKVLWKAVETTLRFDPHTTAVIYTGDNEVSGAQILQSVKNRFDYDLDTDRIVFIYLSHRRLVESSTWPHFTLVGQLFGSIILTIEAILKCPPDVWCDTMGYPFGYPWVWHLLRIPVVTYTHYPVMSSDMLNKLSHEKQTVKVLVKRAYWKLFMMYYHHMGSFVSVASTNSSWTNDHISRIWTQLRTHVIYPPCSTEKLVAFEKESETPLVRKNQAIVLCQFRPEKRHELIIREYATYLETTSNIDQAPKLVFIGSTRSDADRQYVQELKDMALIEKKIPESLFEIMTDLPYEEIKRMLWTSTYGINAMWNEHFGIAVVEYIAGGLIPIVHGSAGPLFDFVIDNVGFFFLDPSDPDYKDRKALLGFGTLHEALEEVSYLTDDDKKKLSDIAIRIALTKFSDKRFDERWIDHVLIKLEKLKKKRHAASKKRA